MKEELTLNGKYTIQVVEDGKIIKELVIKNVVTNVGKALILNNLLRDETTPVLTNVNYLALGSGSNPATSANTSLQTETYRTTFTSSIITGNIITFNVTIPPGAGPLTINEIGAFINATNSAGSGTLLSRSVGSYSRISTQSFVINYQFTLS